MRQKKKVMEEKSAPARFTVPLLCTVLFPHLPHADCFLGVIVCACVCVCGRGEDGKCIAKGIDVSAK